MNIFIGSSIIEIMKETQIQTNKNENNKRRKFGKSFVFEKNDEGLYTYFWHIFIPNFSDTREILLDEVHKSEYLVHVGSTKMYLDLKIMYWCPTMKLDIVKYISNFFGLFFGKRWTLVSIYRLITIAYDIMEVGENYNGFCENFTKVQEGG